MKKIVLVGLLGVAFVAHAVELYSNGAVVNGSGLSIMTAPDNSLGYVSSSDQGVAVADNFSVVGGNGWNVASLDFFAYQTAAAGYTFSSVAWSIVRGADVNTGVVVSSGSTLVSNAGFVGYRVQSTNTTATTRAIYRINADIPDVSLTPGSYWLTWALSGTAASGPFAPPVSTGNGNALQSTAGPASFVALADTGSGASVELPFSINGTVAAIPEPAGSLLMLLGALALWVASGARRARHG